MNQISSTLKRCMAILSWKFPLALALLALTYQLGPARWNQARYGDRADFTVDILLHGTLGPLLTFGAITRIGVCLNKKRARRTADAHERATAGVRHRGFGRCQPDSRSSRVHRNLESWR